MQLTTDDYKAIFAAMFQGDEAALFASTVGENPPVRYETLDLSVARTTGNPYITGFGFRSFVVLSSTDSSVSVNMQLGSQDSNVDPFPVKNNSALRLPGPVQKAFFTWAAQPGKTISILFLLRGEFATNQLVSSVAASMTLFDGDTVATQAGAQVLAAGGLLFAADAARKCMLIENQSGADIYVGSIGVQLPGGSIPGITISSGGSYEWRSTAACYAIAAVNTALLAVSLTKFS